ncbi:HAMP domain-containing sensor histidine kinase [Haloarculaceae archaeon H-GB11]|nr:HAMP domain-containing sensor histidine kinase [Haloarculaceae archaeon H-GB11]
MRRDRGHHPATGLGRATWVIRMGTIRDERIDCELSAALDALGDLVYVLEPSGELAGWNDEFADLTDCTDASDPQLTDFFAEPAHIDGARELVLDTGERVTVDASLDGADRSYELSFDRVGTDDATVLVGIGREVASESLDAERRQNELVEEFAGHVSHDIRNPLQVATAQLELALDECETERLQRVNAALSRIDRLITDSLTLARSGADVTEPSAVDLEPQVRDVWEAVATEEATLRVDFDDEAVEISVDTARLGHLLEQLFDNAVTHAGPDVTVTVGTLEDGFYVADDGPGLTVEDREYVFESGYSTADDGTGFGLAIVDRIAVAHGWIVRATESESGGARFEVTDLS